jgi:diguanylate cyclase (GGDEF)-like protein/PAS domain S-box-containing protein
VEDRIVHEANERAAATFGVPLAEARGKPVLDFWVDHAERDLLLSRVARERTVPTFEARLKRSDGSMFWADISAQLVVVAGRMCLLTGVRDISAQKRTEQRLRELAFLDPLTGLLNRRRFFEVAEDELLRADRYGGAVSLAMIDADHFKNINDMYGHAAGDDVLRHIARVLSTGLRRTDSVGRYGGEELALLLPAAELADAHAVVDELREVIAAEPVRADGVDVQARVSGGVASRRAGESLASLLRRADGALYRAKAEGRNRVVAAT